MHPLKVRSSVVFATFSELCDHHSCLIPERFCHPLPLKTALCHGRSCPIPPPPAWHSVSVDWPVSGVAEKWHRALCGLLCLACVTEHVFRVHPCSMCQHFVVFFCAKSSTSFWCPLLTWPVRSNGAVNVCVLVFVCTRVSLLWGLHLGVELLRHGVIGCLSLRGTSRLFAKQLHGVTAPPAACDVAFSAHPHRYLMLFS